jgi:hypothetical protein
MSGQAKAVDLYKGMDCGRFDPEKADHIHGRRGPGPVLFDRMQGVKVFGCEACVFGDRYLHTCGRPKDIAFECSDGPVTVENWAHAARTGRLAYSEASC